MARLIRKTAILAKLEAAYGQAAEPKGVTDAMLISDATIDYQYKNVSRALLRPYLGGSEELVGTRTVQMSFTVELAGSGTAGTAPAWGTLLRASAMAETVVVGTCVEYTPVSGGMESCTMDYSLDGVRYRAVGCRGTASLGLGEGERPTLKFTFTGLDAGAVTAADPSVNFAAWQIPHVVTNANSAGVLLGCTYLDGAFTGGTAYPSRGLSVELGQGVQHIPLLGRESVEITERDTKGSLQLDLTAAQVVDFMTAINANVPTSLGFTHGTQAGHQVLVFAPSVQRINPKVDDFNGTALLGMDLRLLPTTLGNDEIRIIAA